MPKAAINAQDTPLPLEGEIGLAEAGDLAQRLAAALEPGGRASVDAQGLTRIGAAGLQVLVAAHLAAARMGATLNVSVPADGALAQAMARAGFDRARGLRPALNDGRWTGMTPAPSAPNPADPTDQPQEGA